MNTGLRTGELLELLNVNIDLKHKALTVRQVADLLEHSTSQITETYYVKKDTARLNGITNDFNL